MNFPLQNQLDSIKTENNSRRMILIEMNKALCKYLKISTYIQVQTHYNVDPGGTPPQAHTSDGPI